MGFSIIEKLTPYDSASSTTSSTHLEQNNSTVIDEQDQHQQQQQRSQISKCTCRNPKWRVRLFSHQNVSILSMGLIVLALVFPLILQSTIISATPLRNNDQPYQSKYLLQQQQNYRQLQQQQQLPTQNQQHHHSRIQQRHYRPLSENMETNLDSSASLSIVSPLDILRQNLLLEIHRQRLRLAKTKQVESNREFLEKIG